MIHIQNISPLNYQIIYIMFPIFVPPTYFHFVLYYGIYFYYVVYLTITVLQF